MRMISCVWGMGAVLALAACTGEPTRPVEINGTLRVVLTTPDFSDEVPDGAAVVILTSPAVPTAVTAASGLELWGGPVNALVDTIALTGTLSAGTILTLAVRDVGLASQYTAKLREVAASNSTVALKDLTGYSLAVVR